MSLRSFGFHVRHAERALVGGSGIEANASTTRHKARACTRISPRQTQTSEGYGFAAKAKPPARRPAVSCNWDTRRGYLCVGELPALLAQLLTPLLTALLPALLSAAVGAAVDPALLAC